MKKNNVFLILSIFGVSFLSFFSCKPGLGDAIDTKAPTISISSPTDNFCVRNNFILQGTQSDDRGVTKITVSLKQVENEKIIYDDFEPKFKTVSDEKEEPWTCEINTVEKDSDGNVIKHLIKDGTYTATVTAYDSYNQKNVVTKTFVIDNTPPLVILDTPSSEKLDGADSFGQNFYLNGQVYDKNEIDSIEVSVFEYDEATSEILKESKATIELKDIGTSLESETVADWEKETETSTGKINYYKKIYGDNEKAGNKKFYFKLNSHDKARKLLPDGSVDSSDTGNTTSNFFFNKDEISNIVKNIKPSGIYSLISESFETEGNSRNITTLDSNYLEKLNSNKKEKGTFQLNPDNTPTYVIDGINSFNSLYLLGKEFDFRNDKLKFVLSGTSSITVTFSKGLDKTALMPETFGVKLIKADETGKIVGGGKEYNLLKPIYDFTKKENWGKKDYDTTKLTSNGDNYSATLPITLNEVDEGFYYIDVYGYDQFKIYDDELNQIKGYGNKLSFAEGSDKLKKGYAYGLWIVGSDKAPSLSIYKDKEHNLALGTQNIGKDKDLTIYGIAKDESGQGHPLKISFYKDEETVPFAVYDKDVSGKTDGEQNSDEFEYKIEAAKFEELAGKLTDLGTASFKITVSAQDKNSGLTTSKEINISYDNQAPIIESIDILPNVEVENAEENAPVTVNGKITVKPTVSDASSFTISYKFGEENSEEYKTEYPVQSGKTSFEIDTTKFEDKKEKKLTIFAKDIAGNISSETVTLFVNQETDAPTIEFTNGNKEIKDVEGIKQNEENIFGKSNNKIQFVIKDDDGFEQNGITLSVQKLKYENGKYVADGEPKIQKQPTKETTSVNLNYSLPDEVSAYKITIIAKDKKSETKFSSTEIKDIFVVYDNENPSLKINNYKIGENSEKSYEKVAYSKSSQKIIINGSASDDSNLPVEVKRYDSSDIEDGIPKEKAIGKSMTISDGTWTDEIPSEDVKKDKTYIYIATDMYGKTTNTDFVLKIDDTQPQLKDLEIDGSSYNENRWFKSTAIQFKGKVEDEASGIEVLNYQIENADGTKTDASSSITVNNDGSFSTTLNSFKESNGEKHNTIIFTVKDNAGNEFTRTYEIKIDTVPPTVNNKIEYSFGNEAKKSLESVILSNGEKSITITGTCSDSASGLASAELIIGEQTYDCTIVSGNWTSTITKENLSKMAENSIAKVRIYDNAGNFADSKTFTIKIDKNAPEVSIISPTENATLNEKVKIEGKVEEDNTPLSVEIYSYVGKSVPQTFDDFKLLKKITTQQKPKDESADEKYIYGASVSDIYSWKFEQNVNELLSSTEMKNDLYLLVVAYDEAGNCNVDTENIKESDYKKYKIDKNSDRPIIKFSTLTSASGNIIKNNSTINGSIEDDDGVVSVLKISPNAEEDWASYTQPVGTLSYSSGSFTYTPENKDDGEKKMYFYIKDSAGKEFYTNASEELFRPYVSFKTGNGYSEKEDNNKEISFTLDSTPADVGEPKYAVSSESFEYKTASFDPMGTKNLVGGKNKKFVIFGVEATDDNGIESVVFSFDGGKDSTKIEPQTVETPANGNFYATSAIDLTGKDSGIITLTILVKDKSGFETTVQKQFTIDNVFPEVEIQNPATENRLSTEELTGSVTLSGTAFDSLSTVEEIKYLILDDSYFSDKENEDTEKVYAKLRDSEYTCENKGTTAGWKFILENLPSGSFTEKDGKLISDLSNYSKVETSSEAEGTKTLYYIPVYIYAKDSLGNEYLDFIKLKYNPYGDRPTVDISETAPGTTGNKNTNGSIQINGSAQDNVSVKGVYIQINANKDEKFDDKDIELLKELKNGSEQIYTIIDETSINNSAKSNGKTPNYDAIKYTTDGTETGENFWGIKVNGTNSWNITINKAREFQNDNTKTGDGTYELRYRLIAVDNNYKFGSWTDTMTFTIDTNVPNVSSEGTIVGYSDESRKNQTSSRKYTSDMYLVTTNNYNELQVIVSDKSGIKKVEYYQADSLSELASVKTPIEITLGEPLKSGETGYVEGKKSYLVKIPLNKLNDKDNLAIQIVATKDNIAETTAYAKYSVKFDDTAPTINYISYNGDKVSDATDASNVVENSNSVFTLGGQASDEGSGFARALFFYNRPANETTGSNNRIYDPIAKKDTLIDVTNASTREFGGQTMYGYKPSSVGIGSDKKTITIENSTEKFIYPCGVVYINGSWFTIAKDGVEKSGDYVSQVTVESEIPDAKSYDVFFPYARVIDNTGTEKGGFDTSSTDSPYGDNGDDGDGMPESVIKSQTQWTFDASVRSNFIPDGPGSITVFVFDNAGNCSAKKYDAKVQNNAPRLTKLWLGTDLSGNETFEENEFISYDVFATTGTEQRTYEMNTADFGGTRFRILNKLALVTEFVGGNNAKNNGIKLAFNKDAFSETEKCNTAESGDLISSSNFETSDIKVSEDKFTASGYKNSTDSTKTLSKYAYVISKDELGDDSTGEINDLSNRVMSVTFWDDTEDSTQGKDSGYCYLKIKDLAVIQKDTFAPSVAINPFYWKSPEENSLYKNNYLNGHIDLSRTDGSTLDKKLGLFVKVGEPVLSEKPKVSGKISITGSAIDEHSLASIWASFDGFTPSNGVGGGSVESKEIGEKTYYCVAKFDDDTKNWKTVTAENVSEKEWNFQILETSADQNGNLVTWQLDLDTSAITGAMGNDKNLSIVVFDAAEKPHQSSLGTTTGAELTKNTNTYDVNKYNVPSYTMDVVPYISGIENANRSRLGKYPVRKGEDVVITGFNFASSPKVYRKKTDGTENGKSVTVKSSTSTSTSTSITITAPDYSGYIYASWDVDGKTITTLNNENSNKVGYNIEEGYVAKDTDNGRDSANKAGTNFWTDDRYISVWNVGTSFEGSINPHSGVIKKIRKENTINESGSVGLKRKGSEILPESNMTDNYMGFISSDDMRTYIYKNTEKNVAMSPTSDVSLFTAPVDAVDMIVLGGLPYYVIQTNYVGNVNANCWGPGLMIAREGFAYEKGTYEGTNGLTESSLKWIIERQGSTNSAMERNSSDGYDSILYQFKNPRIAGWHTDSPGDDATYNNGTARKQLDYVYVSYYDSYAKCLKFAAYRSGRDVDSNNNKISLVNTTTNNQWGGGNAGDYELVDEIRSANGNMKTGATVVAGYDTIVNNPTSFTEKAGEWSDIVVDTTSGSPIPVIVYYNETKKCLEVAQGNSKFPKSKNYGVSSVGTLSGADAWYKSQIRPKGSSADFGRYVSAAIDSSGNLHVAAQDATHSTLYYLYLKKSGNSYTVEKSVLLDSASGAGLWTDIELTNPNGTTLLEIAPVVSYINSSYAGTTQGIKVAYISSASENGNIEFDAMTDPATWSAGNQRTSVMADVYEGSGNSTKAKIGVGFNSDMLAIDFLRDEE